MSAGVALSRLMRALPKEQLTPETFQAYCEALGDLDPIRLQAAVTKMIRGRTQPWFPTVGEIREAVAEHVLELPTEQQAIAMVEARIQWGRERAGSAPAVHPLVADALGQVGGYAALRESEEPTATRGRFARVYRDLRAETVHELAVSGVLPYVAIAKVDGPPPAC